MPNDSRINGALAVKADVQPVAAPAAPVGVTAQTVSIFTDVLVSARHVMVAVFMPSVLVRTFDTDDVHVVGVPAVIDRFATA